MNLSDYVLFGLINRFGKINQYTMLHSAGLNFEIDDTVDKLSLKTKLEKTDGNLFVVCNVVKNESSINTLKVVFNISDTDIEKSKLNFFRIETFFLLYGNINEVRDAELPTDGVIGRVLISPKILIRKLILS